MENLYKIINLDIKDKTGNLKAEAHSEVKSTKYFPTFLIDGKSMIFKPLSKTKPLTTPLFAYSEVFWSYIINKYFDKEAPRYYLAKAKGMSEEQAKYSEFGVLVETLTPNGEELINLYDFFMKYPDYKVNIKDYINYCMQNYDYTGILQSTHFIKNQIEGEKLAHQILLSILRQDQNFHYENVLLKEKEGNYLITPPTDFEFSTPFLYPDMPEKYQSIQDNYKKSLAIRYGNENKMDFIYQFLLSEGLYFTSNVTNNVCLIVKRYPQMVKDFIKKLEQLIIDWPNIHFDDPDNFIGPLNSGYWLIGHALYKDNDKIKYEQLLKEIELKTINKETLFNKISADIFSFCKYYALILKTYLLAYYNGFSDLENITIKDIQDKLEIEDIEALNNINIEDLPISLKRTIDKLEE